MKILTFITDIDNRSGGPSRSVPMLVKGLAESAVDITLMTIRSEQMNLHALDGSAAKLHILDSFNTKQVEEYVKSEKFDIIQIQSIWDPRYHKLVKIAQKLNIPYIITPRGMLEPWSLSQSKWKKKLALSLYQKADLQEAACIFATADMEARHVHDLGVNVPCSVIPNGIDISDYPCRKKRAEVMRQVLFLSRIHEKKGIELLIDAWRSIQKSYPDWMLNIVGNGEADYIDLLKHKIKDLGLYGYVNILDPVYGHFKVQMYQCSSIFCLPSYSENFGMVIAEAMSCGVPVITTTNCPWEFLNDTGTGWCIDLSVENLEKALREAVSMDPVTLYEMGQKASQLVHERFYYLNVARRTVELYRWIIEGGDTPECIR